MKEKIESLLRIVHLKWVKAKDEGARSKHDGYWKGQEVAYKEVKDHLEQILQAPIPATPEAKDVPEKL